jgi:hypothetical protein
MGKLRDKWADRGEPHADATAELRRLAGRLDYRRDQLQVTKMHAKSCAEEEAQLDQALTEQEFGGSKAPDVAAAKRREVVERSRAAHAILVEAEKFVEVGERLCEEKVTEIAQQHIDAAYAERQRVEAEIAGLHERAASLNVALDLCDEMAESWGYAGSRWWRLRALFSPSAQRHLENTQSRRRAEREFPPEGADEQAQRIVDDVLAVRSLDYDGNEVPAYTRLSDSGAVRLG